jgi:hypothetical protein
VDHQEKLSSEGWKFIQLADETMLLNKLQTHHSFQGAFSYEKYNNDTYISENYIVAKQVAF